MGSVGFVSDARRTFSSPAVYGWVSNGSEGKAPLMGLHILTDPQAQPEGLQESSRWSESAETTGIVVSDDRTPNGVPEPGYK